MGEERKAVPIPVQKAAAGMRVAALLLRPRGWKVEIAESAAAALSRRLRSSATPVVTASRHAGRVVRWRESIGDCCSCGEALDTRVTGSPWREPSVFADIPPLLA
jgi:hypothetical protein